MATIDDVARIAAGLPEVTDGERHGNRTWSWQRSRVGCFELVAGPGDQYRSLRDLDWSRFACGDKVKLGLHQPDGDQTQVSCVALYSWSPGPRGAFTGKRTLLPVLRSESATMRLLLGRGRYHLSYPVTPRQLLKSADPKFGWLNADNTFTLLAATDAPAPDDTVLLGRDSKDGTLFVHGLRRWSVDLAKEKDCWPGSDWIRAALGDPGRTAHLMRMVGNGLPVTVDRIDGHRVMVSRRLQPSGHVLPGRWVRCQVLGMIDDASVVLAAGASLLRVKASRLVQPAGR